MFTILRGPWHRVRQSARAARRVRRALVVTLALVLTLVGSVSVLAGPSSAGPVDDGWTASGTGAVTVSDGTGSAATMSYNADNSGSATWTFTTTATPASAEGPIKVPYSWEGLHAWYAVTASLETIVDGDAVDTLVDAGPENCCTTPSNGFLYGGVATFDVDEGQSYGFRLRGSNGDINNFLRGTFTLSTKPYVDATIGQDNRQWLGAAPLPAEGVTGTLDEPGEARWFRFPVVPGQKVSVDLSSLPADYDLALYGDIEAAFERLGDGSEVTQLAAASAAGAPGSQTQVPEYPDSVTTVPTSADTLPSTQFAPRIYAPRIYAPRIYAPRIYAPRIYAPRIYAPRIYAPDAYVPDLESDPAFRDAFSAAQNQTLLAVSANTGTSNETVSASTGNTDGYFYVRVQGHGDSVFDATNTFRLDRSTSGGESCSGLQDFSGSPTLAPTTASARAVIVTDTNKLGLAEGSSEQATYLTSLQSLATSTDGVVVDVSDSARVRDLQDQVAAHPDCPYAMNLVARAIKQVVDSYRNSVSAYVVIAGGDEVIPFFRYPDVSGLGQESQFVPPVLADSPSGASLSQDQVQSQDAYGSSTEVTIGGATLPVPDLAVGRLVKTPEEIESTIANYLTLDGGTLPTPTSSLVTGYDFLADAAHAVHAEFEAAIPGPGANDTLIAESGTPHDESWTAADLRSKLLDTHHDLVYLAGHFSANDTLAADFATTFDADELDPLANGGANADKLRNTIVLSAGCHSGYNIVDGAAVPGVTNTADWTQRMAQQGAVLIGGTGYQYGDTDFLEYSERLYLDLARRLHEGPAAGAPPVAVGKALTLAKQDYLASLGTVTGIDQKAVLQATLYGLPMTGFDAPGRTPLGTDASQITPQSTTSGPGATLGLRVDDLDLTPQTVRGTKDSGAGPDLPDTLSWLNGADGVSVQPGAPALPKQVENVTVPGQVLRGVGFRGGDYRDTPGLLPLTGAPAIEGSTANTTFESNAFFPQRLATPNYFGSLGPSGRTSLVVTPAQYRSDPGGALTNTERAYSGLGLRLFYSGNDSTAYGSNRPALAAPPSISSVSGTVRDGVVTFSARATGDPSAGVQQVWVTWTGGPDASGLGRWRSLDLTQDPSDSTGWTGTMPLPAGQSATDLRFVVQAVNGIGAVGLDTAEGDGYRVTSEGAQVGAVTLEAHAPSADSPLGVTAAVEDAHGAPMAGQTVRFTVSRGGVQLFEYASASAADGSVELRVPPGEELPSGRLTVRADLVDESGATTSTDSTETVVPGVVISSRASSTRAGTAFPRLRALVTDARGPVEGVPVTFTLPTGTPGATFPGGTSTATASTSADGIATAPVIATAGPVVGAFTATMATEGADDTSLPMAAQYAITPFQSPVRDDSATTAKVNATTPLKTTVLLADNRRISDAAAAGLVDSGRVQVRWLEVGTTRWVTRPDLVRYDPKKDVFQANLKGSSLGWVEGRHYLVSFRVLPATSDPQPAGPVLQSWFDLGRRTALFAMK